MDFLFHAASAAGLAWTLGEERPRQLFYAAAIGVLPDAFWPVVQLAPERRYLYSVLHSLLLNVPLCLIICRYNWRIAFGGLLHVFIDVFTHRSSTMHALFPFSRLKLPVGVNWWSWPGLIAWAILWTILLTSLVLVHVHRRRLNDPGET